MLAFQNINEEAGFVTSLCTIEVPFHWLGANQWHGSFEHPAPAH